MIFTVCKNIPHRQSYRILKSEKMGNYCTHANLNRDFPKMTIFEVLKSIFSYNSYPVILKLNLVVLGAI